MRSAWIGALLLAVLLLPLSPGRSAAPASRKSGSSATEAACRAHVQRFYDWYLPRLMREVHVTAMEEALDIRPRDFSAALRDGLREDLAAAAKSPDEIVGLDFEPFVNSQDPAGKYVARKVTHVGKSYRVEVHSVIDGKVSEEPDVIPELVQWRGHWTFVNFHYPPVEAVKTPDLVKLLQLLKADRKKHPHGKPR